MRLVAQQEGSEEQMEVWQSGKVRFQAELLERGQGFTILLGDQGKASREAKWNNFKEASERERWGQHSIILGQRSAWFGTKEFGRTIRILIFPLTEQLRKIPTHTLKIHNFSLKLKLVES